MLCKDKRKSRIGELNREGMEKKGKGRNVGMDN